MPAPKVQMKSVEKNVTARLVVALRMQRESIPTFFFCAARFVHAFRVYEKAATFFGVCVQVLQGVRFFLALHAARERLRHRL